MNIIISSSIISSTILLLVALVLLLGALRQRAFARPVDRQRAAWPRVSIGQAVIIVPVLRVVSSYRAAAVRPQLCWISRSMRLYDYTTIRLYD